MKHLCLHNSKTFLLKNSQNTIMEQNKEKNTPWLSVPQFGEWDQKGPLPDYSMDFSKIREMRKQNKTNASRASLGNEEEFTTSAQKDTKTDDSEIQHAHYHKTNSSATRRSFLSYFNCCIKA